MRLHSLSKRPELNGRIGRAGEFHVDLNRLSVRLEDPPKGKSESADAAPSPNKKKGAVIAIQPDNLKRVLPLVKYDRVYSARMLTIHNVDDDPTDSGAKLTERLQAVQNELGLVDKEIETVDKGTCKDARFCKCRGMIEYCRLRRVQGELKIEINAIKEQERVWEVIAEYKQRFPLHKETHDVECPLCMEPLTMTSAINICCGKIKCENCSERIKLGDDGRNIKCVFCRQLPPETEDGDIKLLNERISQGKTWAMWHLAMNRYLQENDPLFCPKKGLKLLRKAANGGYVQAASDLAFYLYEHSKDRGDYTKSRSSENDEITRWAMFAAERGFLFREGMILAEHFREPSEKLFWITLSALSGNGLMQATLGNWYFEDCWGEMEFSKEKALFWLENSAKNKSHMSNELLGNLTFDFAIEWYGTKGCRYAEHDAVPRALFWYKRASIDFEKDALGKKIERSSSIQAELCSHCFKKRKEFLGERLPFSCKSCDSVHYCSLQCLAKDWKFRHVNDCPGSVEGFV